MHSILVFRVRSDVSRYRFMKYGLTYHQSKATWESYRIRLRMSCYTFAFYREQCTCTCRCVHTYLSRVFWKLRKLIESPAINCIEMRIDGGDNDRPSKCQIEFGFRSQSKNPLRLRQFDVIDYSLVSIVESNRFARYGFSFLLNLILILIRYCPPFLSLFLSLSPSSNRGITLTLSIARHSIERRFRSINPISASRSRKCAQYSELANRERRKIGFHNSNTNTKTHIQTNARTASRIKTS